MISGERGGRGERNRERERERERARERERERSRRGSVIDWTKNGAACRRTEKRRVGDAPQKRNKAEYETDSEHILFSWSLNGLEDRSMVR